MATFVIVHGWWSGGWYFQSTARLLRAAGHEVYTPTLTGIGERVHLASPDVDLATNVRDIVNVVEFEDLNEIVLVGFSYGGMVVTAAAEHIAPRISRMVYLDAFVPRDGESLADIIPELTAEMEEEARLRGDGWRVPRDPPHPRKTPQPIAGFRQPVHLESAQAAAIPRTYVLFSRSTLPHAPAMARIAAHARSAGWDFVDLPVDHTAPETDEAAIAALLDDIVAD